MTPDAYTYLQILNCTPDDLYSGVGNDNAGFFHQYQMATWFSGGDFNSPSSVVVPARDQSTYLLQFERGVGDEDDAADMQLNVGSGNRGANNVVWLQARSASNSAHYIQAQTQSPNLPERGPFAFAFVQDGTWPSVWPSEGPTGILWYVAPTLIPMGAPNGNQCLVIIDLQAVFTSSGQDIYDSLKLGQPSDADAEKYWRGIGKFMLP